MCYKVVRKAKSYLTSLETGVRLLFVPLARCPWFAADVSTFLDTYFLFSFPYPKYTINKNHYRPMSLSLITIDHNKQYQVTRFNPSLAKNAA